MESAILQGGKRRSVPFCEEKSWKALFCKEGRAGKCYIARIKAVKCYFGRIEEQEIAILQGRKRQENAISQRGKSRKALFCNEGREVECYFGRNKSFTSPRIYKGITRIQATSRDGASCSKIHRGIPPPR